MHPQPQETDGKLRIDFIQGRDGNERLGRLLDRAFPVQEGRRFFDDFPIWDDQITGDLIQQGKILRLGVFNGEDLVGSAGARLCDIKISDAKLRAVLIGGVATLKEYQGKGFASQLVNVATQWAAERGASLAMLWGSEHTLYQRLGFELCGMQVRARLDSLGLQPSMNSPTQIASGWHPSLHSHFLMKRTGGVVLEAEDRRWIEAHRNVEWYWTGRPEAPTAYVAIGRGIDLQGMIHEWGGQRDALKGLLPWLLNQHPAGGALELLGPSWHFDLYGLPYDLSLAEYLGMAKVLDFAPVMACFPDGRDVRSELKGKQGTDADLLRALFGPPSQDFPFPLPLWAWGLDAV